MNFPGNAEPHAYDPVGHLTPTYPDSMQSEKYTNYAKSAQSVRSWNIPVCVSAWISEALGWKSSNGVQQKKVSPQFGVSLIHTILQIPKFPLMLLRSPSILIVIYYIHVHPTCFWSTSPILVGKGWPLCWPIWVHGRDLDRSNPWHPKFMVQIMAIPKKNNNFGIPFCHGFYHILSIFPDFPSFSPGKYQASNGIWHTEQHTGAGLPQSHQGHCVNDEHR